MADLLHEVEHPQGKKQKHERMIIIGAAVAGLILTYLMYRESKASASATEAAMQPGASLPADQSQGSSGGGTPNSVDLSGLSDALSNMASELQTNTGQLGQNTPQIATNTQSISDIQTLGTSAVAQDSILNGGVAGFQGRVDTVLQNWRADIAAGRPPSATQVSQFEQHVNTVVAGLTPTEAAQLQGAGGAEGFQSRADAVLNNYIGDASAAYSAPKATPPKAASTAHKKAK